MIIYNLYYCIYLFLFYSPYIDNCKRKGKFFPLPFCSPLKTWSSLKHFESINDLEIVGLAFFAFIKRRLLFVTPIVPLGSWLNFQRYSVSLLQVSAIVFFSVSGLERIQLEARISVNICFFTNHLEEERDSVQYYCLQCSHNLKIHTKTIYH